MRIAGEAGGALVGRSRSSSRSRTDRTASCRCLAKDSLNRVLQSVLVVPLTTNLDRAKLAGTAVIASTADGPSADSVALAFQMRAIPKSALRSRIRPLLDTEVAELELATDEALGRVEPE